MLRSLADAGFAGASVPVGIDPDGRERLVFIPGDVAIPLYPAWVQSDAALGSIARLLRQMHDVSTTVPVDPDSTWSEEVADPLGGEVFCHNDVCLENVVFRDGVAVGLLDFDFAAPGRREFELASTGAVGGGPRHVSTSRQHCDDRRGRIRHRPGPPRH